MGGHPPAPAMSSATNRAANALLAIKSGPALEDNMGDGRSAGGQVGDKRLADNSVVGERVLKRRGVKNILVKVGALLLGAL